MVFVNTTTPNKSDKAINTQPQDMYSFIREQRYHVTYRNLIINCGDNKILDIYFDHKCIRRIMLRKLPSFNIFTLWLYYR